MVWIEATATLFGLVCVWLTVRQSIWCWPTGLVQVVLFCIIFWHVRLYSDLILHLIYIGLQIYGWYHWLHGGSGERTLPVTRLARKRLTGWIVGAILGSLCWGYTMDSLTDASVPYPDAFTTVASLIAQWLMARKKLESWLFWITVDVVAIGVYFYKSLYFTTGLYVAFLILATMGYWAWRQSTNDAQTVEKHEEDRPDTGKIRPSSSGPPTAD